MLRHVTDMTTVDDRTLIAAMFYLWERLKLVVEPTGALGAAAAFDGSIPIAGRRVGVILTGGNVDLSQVSQWLAQR
jgi:threonine dehydratase